MRRLARAAAGGRYLLAPLGIHGGGAGQGRGLVLVDLANWEKWLRKK